MARHNRKSKLPYTQDESIYSFVRKGDTAIVGWLESQLPYGYKITRTVLFRSSRDRGYTSLTVCVQRPDGKLAGVALDRFLHQEYLPSTSPRAIALETRRRFKFFDDLYYSRRR